MTLSERLKQGQNVYGTLITSNSPRFVNVTAGIGLDYVFIDTEHVALDRLTLAWMCETYKLAGMIPIVRIPSHSPYEATCALDGGAKGVVAPYVETIDQVKQLRGAVKLRPLKGEKLRELLNTNEPPEKKLNEYVMQHNATNTLIINIESVPAMENLEEILSVPDVDAVLIGPHDLSCSLGIPEEYSHPRFEEAALYIIRTARAKGVGAGIHITYGNNEQEIRFAKAGANLILHGADIIAYDKDMKKDIDEIKFALGDQDRTRKNQLINI